MAAPTPPTPFWKWPWDAWSRLQRTAMALQLLVKFLLAAAALIAALVYLVPGIPKTYHAIFWQQSQYEKLRNLHAGYDLTYIETVLGTPVATKQTSFSSPLTQHIFLGRGYTVLVIADEASTALLYSVTSCDENFTPKFDTPMYSTISLQDKPLAEAEASKFSSSGLSAALPSENITDHQITYHPGSTGSSIDLLIDSGTANGSNASGGRSYYYGINGICASTATRDSFESLTYSGLLSEADPVLKTTREKIAANFYTEHIAYDWKLTDEAQLAETNDTGEVIENSPLTPIAIYQYDLPGWPETSASTRTFN